MYDPGEQIAVSFSSEVAILTSTHQQFSVTDIALHTRYYKLTINQQKFNIGHFRVTHDNQLLLFYYRVLLLKVQPWAVGQHVRSKW